MRQLSPFEHVYLLNQPFQLSDMLCAILFNYYATGITEFFDQVFYIKDTVKMFREKRTSIYYMILGQKNDIAILIWLKLLFDSKSWWKALPFRWWSRQDNDLSTQSSVDKECIVKQIQTIGSFTLNEGCLMC